MLRSRLLARRRHLVSAADEQKIRLIREFLDSDEGMSIRGFAEFVRNNGKDDKERSLKDSTFSRWVQDASEEVEGVVKLPGLNDEERRQLLDRRQKNRHLVSTADEQKIRLIREFVDSDERISIRGFAEFRSLKDSTFSRWLQDASEEVEGVVKLPGLNDEERRQLQDRRQKNNPRKIGGPGRDADAGKLVLIRKFLSSDEGVSIGQFVADLKENGKDDDERSLSKRTFSRWLQDASEEVGGVVKLPGLDDEERSKLLDRRRNPRAKFDGLGWDADAWKLGLIRGFLSSGENVSIKEYVDQIRENGTDDSERNLSRTSFSRWLQDASEEVGGVVKLPGLDDEERSKLLDRRENISRAKSGGLGSSAMASAAAAQPTPTPLSSSDSYGATPLPLGAAPTPLPGIESFDRIAGLYGTALPSIVSFDRAAYSGPYGTGRAPSPTPFKAQGYPGYGGPQGPARGGR
ncbi:hypothetical protein ACJ6WF_26165 [Streptomyces sp. MMS24-I2-30]|uniref:hypothetical protein n=1 Tax=Streptomyces sp. MMS24-I2-30 TaxID=3351564 RepID=UPI00389687E5